MIRRLNEMHNVRSKLADRKWLSSAGPPMSALGQKQTLSDISVISAVPTKADINSRIFGRGLLPQLETSATRSAKKERQFGSGRTILRAPCAKTTGTGERIGHGQTHAD